MKEWEKRAEDSRKKSLYPVPQEPNELDWKSRLSDDSSRLAPHLSSFANQQCGGFLFFGIENNGSITGITREDSLEIAKRLGNLARDGVEPPVILDHCVMRCAMYAVAPFQLERIE